MIASADSSPERTDVVELVAARLAILGERDVLRDHDVGAPLARVAEQPFDGGVLDLAVADSGGRRPCTAADACCAHDSNLARIDTGLQALDQLICARNHATDGLADADRHGCRPRLAFFNDVEVVVERGDLVDLRLR